MNSGDQSIISESNSPFDSVREPAEIVQGAAGWQPTTCAGHLRTMKVLPGLVRSKVTIAGAVETGAKTAINGVASRAGRMSKKRVLVRAGTLKTAFDIETGFVGHFWCGWELVCRVGKYDCAVRCGALRLVPRASNTRIGTCKSW